MTRRERMEARRQRRLDWAEGRDRKSEQGFAKARAIGDRIPLGQPILVGHHSEKRHRGDIARIDSGMNQGFESREMANLHRSRASGIQDQLDRSIFSDDPDAVERLRERIAGLEADRERLKTVNAQIKRGPGWEKRLAKAGQPLSDHEKQKLMDVARFQGYNCFPPYALQNIAGNIRRLKQRLISIGGASP